jgi:hypothetical protein
MRTRLVPVTIGSKKHIDLVRAGCRTHHVDGNITWLEFLQAETKGTETKCKCTDDV